MKVSGNTPVFDPSPSGSEWLRSAAALFVGAILAYGTLLLAALLRPEQPAATPAVRVTPAESTVIEAPQANDDDPWWRGDEQFWREQARLNSAAVAPQYRELQVTWARQMAATAELRAQQANQAASKPLALPAKERDATPHRMPAGEQR